MGSCGGYVVCDCEYEDPELPMEWKLALDGASPLLFHGSVLCGLWVPDEASEIKEKVCIFHKFQYFIITQDLVNKTSSTLFLLS